MTAQFIRSLDNFPGPSENGAVVTVGTFDGIHLGHQEILRRVKSAHDIDGLDPVLVTFNPHPKVLVSPKKTPMLLTSIEEKEQFVPDFFDGKVLVLEFNEALMNLSAEEFVSSILVDRVGVKKLIVGYDHGFGKGREGSIPALKVLGRKFGFDVEVVDPIFHNGNTVSSTRIRKIMAEGSYEESLELLGHYYAIYGTVERGIGLGRKLGYPTANVKYSPRKLLPSQGVYACWAEVSGLERDGMMFIGQNHFNPNQRITVEANLFDFDQDVYDQEIIVYPTRFVRENRKFNSKEALIKQIEKDKKEILQVSNKGEKQWL
jgi:riboflavin kinase/FMN adenylyltransferase